MTTTVDEQREALRAERLQVAPEAAKGERKALARFAAIEQELAKLDDRERLLGLAAEEEGRRAQAEIEDKRLTAKLEAERQFMKLEQELLAAVGRIERNLKGMVDSISEVVRLDKELNRHAHPAGITYRKAERVTEIATAVGTTLRLALNEDNRFPAGRPFSPLERFKTQAERRARKAMGGGPSPEPEPRPYQFMVPEQTDGLNKVASSVLRIKGEWARVMSPSQVQIAAADRVYLGGRVHQLTEAEANELRTAGFGDWLRRNS